MGKLFVFILIFSGFQIGFAEDKAALPRSSLQQPLQSRGEEEELSIMSSMVENTAHQLIVQRQIKQLMADFIEQKKAFEQGNQTKTHAARMVKTARQLYEGLTTHHLDHLFSKQYLDELIFFASIAGKNRLKN